MVFKTHLRINSSNLEFNENDNDKICNYYFQSYKAPFSAVVSSDPLIRHKNTYVESRVDGWGGLIAINNAI